MKLNINGKHVVINEKITEAVTEKANKLGKYFTDDIQVNVLCHPEKAKIKLETTIHTKGTIFRAESVEQDIFDCIDDCFDKLMKQMQKYKGKLINKKQGKESIRFEEIPEPISEPTETVVKKKRLVLEPMTVEEAALQMELLGHTFFVFKNSETDEIDVVYKRTDSDYGLLETTK